MSDFGYEPGWRPRSRWCGEENELPAPYAVGDRIRVPEGARALERMHGMGPGEYVVCAAFSIDEGDAWYFRLAKDLGEETPCSDRLHVACAARASGYWKQDVDWLEGCTLLETADPAGLELRERMIAEGWTPQDSRPHPG